MSNTHERYLSPAYTSPKSPYQIPIVAKNTLPTTMARSSSYDPHRVLGYFDIPSRSAPSSPQGAFFAHSPVSRSSSPARDVRRSRELNQSHSGSDFDDALVGFSLVPNWLKMAMEQDQHSGHSSAAAANKSASQRPSRYSPLNSPDSLMTTSNDTSPLSPRTPQLNVKIPHSNNLVSDAQYNANESKPELENDDYWEEEDEGYWGEMEEEEQDEDLEEAYRSVL
jgi:hypothetical protein